MRDELFHRRAIRCQDLQGFRYVAVERVRSDKLQLAAEDLEGCHGNACIRRADAEDEGSAAVSDKTMPRLLELSENAQGETIVGPGTPLSSVFFDYGVSDLSGFVATDAALAKRIIRGAENQRIFGAGMKVEYLRPGA